MAVSERLVGRGDGLNPPRIPLRRWAADAVRTPWLLTVLFQLVLTVYAVGVYRWPLSLPIQFAAVVAVVAGLFLPPRQLLVSFALNLVTVLALVPRLAPSRPTLFGFILVELGLMGLLYWVGQHRELAGVTGIQGEQFITDLRERLSRQSRLPVLPHDWTAEVSIAPARGDTFAGDLVVSTINEDRYLEVALVDISGQGSKAGGRALIMSGAVSGLLGALPRDGLLSGINAHLCRNGGDEELATAAHLEADLATGRYSIAYGGHPPAVQYFAGTGRWRPVTGSRGPALGVIDGARFPRIEGSLGRGDAIVMFSDGAIETRDRSLQEGLDKLLGSAERSVSEGFGGLAKHLCDTAPCRESDDRAVFVLWRR